MDPLLNLEQAAKAINVSESFLRRLVDKRQITCRRVGRSIRFAAIDIENYIESCRCDVKGPAEKARIAGKKLAPVKQWFR